MLNFRERWRAGKPEFLILVGVWIGFVGNVISLPLVLMTQPSSVWQPAVAALIAGVVLSGLAAFVLARRASRTTNSFVFIGAISTALAVVSIAGLIGGGVALAGATWGIVQTYEPRR